MPVLGEQLLPHLRMPLFHGSELAVDVPLVRIGLLPGQHQVQVSGVVLVLPVLEPGAERGLVDGGHGYEDSRNLQDGNWLDTSRDAGCGMRDGWWAGPHPAS